MKKLLSSVVALLFALAAHAQHYIPQDENSKVAFSVVNHMLVKSTVTGTLQDVKGNITFNPADINSAAFDVSVNVGTIKTGISMRDSHLKKEEFFNADKFPAIRITSTRVAKGTAPNSYILYGTLSMKGITKSITLPFTATATQSPVGLIFKGSFSLNRLDYAVGKKGKIEDGVNIDLVVATRKM